VPAHLPATKQAVRDFLRASGREHDWTELQGVAYGPRITDAEPFPGLKPFLARCRAAGARVAVVSHKTRRPYRGADHDLHAAAHKFLEAHGLYETSDTGLSPDRVFLEPTPAQVTGDRLAAAAGLGPVYDRVPLAGGANNRVYRAETAGGSAFLKAYFRHPADPRDRLAAESAFARFAWAGGVRCVPRPLAFD